MFLQRHFLPVSQLIRKVYPSQKLNPHLLEFFDRIRLSQVNPLLIEEFKQFRMQTVSNASVNRELAALKHSFNQAILWGLVKQNPVKGVKFLRETPKDRYLTYSEEELILSASPEWLRQIILFDLQTGLRLGELTSLTWGKVDLDQKTLTVIKSKNGLPRVIPLNLPAIQVLESIGRQNNQHRIFN